MTPEDVSKNLEAFNERNEKKSEGSIVKQLKFSNYNKMEQSFKFEVFTTSEQEMTEASKVFEEIKTKAYYPSDEDLKKIIELLPNADLEKFRQFRAKSQQGTCDCDRNLSVYDLIKFALDIKIHSTTFLTDMLNGSLGNVVIAGSDGPQEIKDKMPKNTVWINNITSVPCSECGKQHFLHLSTPELLHHWVLAVQD